MHVTKTGIVRMNGNNNGNGQKYSRGESFSAAALMNRNSDHAFDAAPGGIAFRLNPDAYSGGKNSAERERVASFVNNWIQRTKDPASDIPGAPPLFGQDVVPQAMTFASKIGSQAKTYLPSDEALEANPNDALLMRKDLGIMECLEIRQRMSALLDWSIVPEDTKSPAQKSVAAELTKIVRRVKRFTEYKRCLMDAIWIGRSAIQHTYGHGNIGGKMYCYPRAKHADATGWKHIHGDKIVFRYDDGEKLANGAFPDQMGIRVSSVIQKDSRIRGIQDLEYTNSGAAIFLSPAERQTIICHKHMIEDAEYQNPRKAGRIHGVGIRDRIYNEWFLKQEMLGFLMEYMERSAGGIEIYEYPSGDEAAKRSIMEAAKNRMAFGRNQIFFPKPLGMDAGVYDIRIVEPGFAGMDMLVNILDKYFGHRIKRYIIGQTLSTEADATGLGSSVADFQKDSLAQIVMYDSSNLEETLTHELVRPIHLANWPETESWQFELKLELESDNVKEKLDAYQAAWQMGLGIPEKDVAEAIGVSLDNPNEKMLRNTPAGPGGMGNGMQFPAGTGFGNQIDAAHEHVKAAGEVKGLKDGVIDHVAGKVNGGSPSSPADNFGGQGPATADSYEREFVEEQHPRDEIGRFTAGEHGASFDSPELGKRMAFPMKIEDSDDANAQVSNGYFNSKVPKESLQQLHADLTGDMSYLKKHGSSGNAAVDAVVNGQGKMVGKGDDSVVFQVGDKIVKASTTVPYHPVGGGMHRTPTEAIVMARKQFETGEKLREMGVPGIPKAEMVRHGDKVFTVRDNLAIGTPLNKEQLQNVKDSVEALHNAGYAINDQLQVGVGPDGKAYHFDLGKAEKTNSDYKAKDEMRDVEYLWKQNGETWRPSAKQAAEDFERAKSLAQIDIDRGRPVREMFKKQLVEALDHLNHHDAEEWWGNTEWMHENNIDFYSSSGVLADQYARQMSLWDEEEHPRDEAGKFSEKGDSRASSFPAETLPDGKVRMKQAKAGGETSDVDGKFYKGGRLMPVHGLYSGREKPAPKPKKENPFGSLPVANEDGKGLPSVRKRTDEQIERERQEMQDKAAWLSVQSGPVRDMVWVGDKPGKTAYEVKKQLVPFLSGLSDEQVQQIGEFAFQSVIDHESEQYPDVDREIIESEFNGHAAYTADLLLNKKIRKEFPSMERTVEAIRQYSDLPDQLQRWVEMDEHLRDVLGAVGAEKYQRRSSRLLSEAASSTHTSPTPAQREAGNYSKGIFPWKGLEIAIENPKGSTRSGLSPSTGREWSRTMSSHYGYFRRTKANDGDNLDVFIGPHPDSEFVLVIKQVDQDGDFDEFKVVVGCLNRKEAKKLYLANYPKGWKCGPAASMTVELFKKWVEKGGPMKAKSIKAEC